MSHNGVSHHFFFIMSATSVRCLLLSYMYNVESRNLDVHIPLISLTLYSVSIYQQQNKRFKREVNAMKPVAIQQVF